MTRRISNPYEKIAHKTERTNNQKLVQWMNEIIQAGDREDGLKRTIAEESQRGRRTGRVERGQNSKHAPIRLTRMSSIKP